jgi:hypothetical protein
VLAVSTTSPLAFVPLKDAIAKGMSYLFRIPLKPQPRPSQNVSVPLELDAHSSGRFVVLGERLAAGDRLAQVVSVQNPEELDDQDVVYLNYSTTTMNNGREGIQYLPFGISISHMVPVAGTGTSYKGSGSMHVMLSLTDDGGLGALDAGSSRRAWTKVGSGDGARLKPLTAKGLAVNSMGGSNWPFWIIASVVPSGLVLLFLVVYLVYLRKHR